MFEEGLVIVSGKGGVGKSAVTAAIAQHAAARGQRVLAIATNDAGGLAAHLGQNALGYVPDEIMPGLFATGVDLPSALTEYLHLQLKVPTPGFGMVARAFDVLVSAAPGMREIITIGKVAHEVGRDVWDLVVVDAPATGQLGSYLRAPETVSDLVPAGRVRDQSAWMESILAADSTRILLVSLLEELPVRETLEAARDIGSNHRVGTHLILANRVLPRLGISATRIANLGPGPIRHAAEHHQALYAAQQQWLTALSPRESLPYLFGILTPAEVAACLADELAVAT